MHDRSPEIATRLSNVARRVRTGEMEALIYELLPTAYWHPNGFLKALISQTSDDGILRLHLWPERCSGSTPLDDIHSHRWHYKSLVVAGSLVVERFAESSYGTTYRRFACPPNEHGGYSLMLDEIVCLNSSETTCVRAGSEHQGTETTIHRTQPAADGVVVSAFLQSQATRSRSCVYRLPSDTRALQTSPRSATAADIKVLLDQIAAQSGIVYD